LYKEAHLQISIYTLKNLITYTDATHNSGLMWMPSITNIAKI